MATDQLALLTKLRGQKVSMPDFQQLIDRYPSKLNPFYSQAIFAADEIIDFIYKNDTKKCKRMKKADFALFAAYVYPEAQLAELSVLTYWVIWIFAWDDESDLLDGEVTLDLSKGDIYRERTLSVVYSSLGLASADEGYESDEERDGDAILASFQEMIGPAIRKAYTLQQREQCYEEIALFLQGTRSEQVGRLEGRVFGMEEYVETRREVSGAGFVLAMIEFALQMKTGRKWREDAEMARLWDDSVSLMWIINDMLSLSKEMANDTAINLLPIKCANGSSLQEAFDDSADFINLVIDRFEDSAQNASLDRDCDELFAPGERALLVKGMRDMWAGNHHWHFQTPRYGFNKEFYKGTFEFTV